MKLTLLLVLVVPVSFAAPETPVTPKVESIGLFKNGLAVVRASFPVPSVGSYRLEEVPRAVHGSLWVESDGVVGIRSTTRVLEVIEPSELPSGNLQQDLAGKSVTVTLRADSSQVATLAGTVWAVPPAIPARTWDANFSSLSPENSSFGFHFRPQGSQSQSAVPSTGEFLVLQQASGERHYIARSSIITLLVNGPFAPATRREERPVLVFDVTEIPSHGGRVQVTYLTKGLAWQPSYRLDLDDSSTLRIRQNAVVRNEINAFDDTELQLISGFPNVRFGAVDSPIWPGTSLASFFQQVNQTETSAGILGNNLLTQQAVYMNSAGRGASSPLPNVAEQGNASDDIHYESIGRHSMKAGDSLAMDVATATADYQRVVEWTIPDPRDERGRYRPRPHDGESASEPAWDAVRFINPFKFPMTTGATMVVERGRFRGQSQSEWVNPGQQTCLRITRALSVRTEAGETEEEGKRDIVFVGGNDYQRTTVKGRLTVRNFRNQDIILTIRGEFSGELLEADGEPAKSLRTEGVSSINPRRRLDWTLPLSAGEEKVLTYRYNVLVDH
jgi:hypothetical protein